MKNTNHSLWENPIFQWQGSIAMSEITRGQAMSCMVTIPRVKPWMVKVIPSPEQNKSSPNTQN